MNVSGKAWFASKTVWFGILWVVVSIAAFFGFNEYTPTPFVMDLVATLNGVAILVLRYFTKTPITLK